MDHRFAVLYRDYLQVYKKQTDEKPLIELELTGKHLVATRVMCVSLQWMFRAITRLVNHLCERFTLVHAVYRWTGGGAAVSPWRAFAVGGQSGAGGGRRCRHPPLLPRTRGDQTGQRLVRSWSITAHSMRFSHLGLHAV